jgi:hypothetical protein
VGGLDELTPDLFTIADRLGLWKKEPVDSLRLKDYNSRGSLAGEGAAFFALSSRKKEKTIARLSSVMTFFNPAILSDNVKKIVNVGKPDVVILGINGDTSGDEVYASLRKGIFSNMPVAYYKHLCGEYDTSTAFALAMAAGIIREQRVPDIMKLDIEPAGEIHNILIYNHFRKLNHSAILVSSC